jgi:IS30 family transposase
MKKKPKLTTKEKFEIDHLFNIKKFSLREIGRLMDRNTSTISREMKRNEQKKKKVYEAKMADGKARLRKRQSKFQWKKIEETKDLKEYIIKGLKKYQNPDEISGRMKFEKQPFYASKTTIYDWLRSNRGQRYCRYLYSKRYRVKKRKTKKAKRILIPNRISIELRPKGATNKTRYGHCESDTLVSGKRGSGAISVLYERKTKYCFAKKLNTLKPKENARALKNFNKSFNIKSITFDNGIENTRHEELGVPTFFCEPYSSWQKGGIENINKMMRRFIPKGTNISKIPEEKIKKIIDMINKKPRKSLGYKSAYEVAIEKGLLIDQESVAIEG